MASRSTAVATESAAEGAAERALHDGGSAADAVLAGFFAAAGARPGALLGPVEVLVGGLGTGSRAFDGRPRQPGLGAPRPRGFATGQPVAPAARVAIPCSLGAAALVHAYGGKLAFARLVRSGVEGAANVGADERAKMLDRVGRRGAAALRDRPVVRALLAAGGKSEHGLLTERDLDAARPASEPPLEEEGADGEMLMCPWGRASSSWSGSQGPGSRRRALPRRFEIVAAIDAHGAVAVLAYRPDDEGVPLEGAGVVLPRDAVPVERGVVRVAPGAFLGPSAAIALLARASHVYAAIGVTSDGGWPRGRTQWPLVGVLSREVLGGLAKATSGTTAVAVLQSTDSPLIGGARGSSPVGGSQVSRRRASKVVWNDDGDP